VKRQSRARGEGPCARATERRWSFPRKDAAYALGAALIHAGIFAALFSIPKPTFAPATEETKVVEIDPNWIEPEAPMEPVAAAPPTPVPAAAPAAAIAAVRPAREKPTAESTGGGAAVAAGEVTPPSGGDPNGAVEPTPAPARAPLSLAQLGVLGPGRSVQGTLAPEAESQIHASESALRASITRPLAEYDRDIGLGPEGPVIEDLLKGVYASAINLKGKVTFRASFDAHGRIVSLAVLSCDGERSLWEELGNKVKSELEGKEGRRTSEGYESDIEVVTSLKLPSGADPGAEVSVFGFSLKDGGGPEATKIAILPLKPELATLTIGDTKVVVPVVMFTLLRMQGDLSDIGANPRRVVHARVVNKPKQWKLPPGIKPNARWELNSVDRDKYDRKNENGGAQIEPRTPRL